MTDRPAVAALREPSPEARAAAAKIATEMWPTSAQRYDIIQAALDAAYAVDSGAALEAPPKQWKYPSERQLGNLAHLLTYGGDEMVMRRAFDTVVRAYHETAPDNAHWRRALEAWLTTAVDAVVVRGEAPPEPEKCVKCGQIPDSPFSSANPALTICRACYVGEAGPLPPASPALGLLEEARKKYWDLPLGEPRALVRRLSDALEKQLWGRGVVPAPPPEGPSPEAIAAYWRAWSLTPLDADQRDSQESHLAGLRAAYAVDWMGR